jgi:putative copper resistance protein D
VLETAVILFRLVQYLGAMILFGSSLFFLYVLPKRRPGFCSELAWSRPLLGWGAGGLLAATLLGFLAQTSVLAGSIADGLKLHSLSAVITTMAMGPSTVIRAAAAAVGLVALAFVRPGDTLFAVCALLGALATASFAWMGHGAATEGTGHLLHTGADIVHALAAGGWVGALVVFFGLLHHVGADAATDRILCGALNRFAGVGSGLVAVLVATGLVNSWFLIGPSRLSGLLTTLYGQLLSLKLLLFAGMLAFAAVNRFRLTPALSSSLTQGLTTTAALTHLRRSLLLETALAAIVLGLVAWLGTLAPISSV